MAASGSLAGLLGANALMLAAGLGVTGVRRAPVAYLAGIALCGVLAAELAVVGVAYGWTLLALTAAGAWAFRIWRLRRSDRAGIPLPRVSPAALAGVAVLAVLLVRAAPLFAIRPLDAYDGWAMWAMKGHALATLGWADPKLFASPPIFFLHLDYPLFLPSLEAIAYRSLGAFDPRLVHVQFLLLGVAGVAALAWLAREAPTVVVWTTVAAVATAPSVLQRLATAYADLPLALLVAAGLAALARWLPTRERFCLELATLLFAAAALTKNEGLLVVGAAYLAALAYDRRRWLPLVVSAAVVEACLLPWQIYVRAHDIHSDSVFAAALRLDTVHPGVARPAAQRLLEEALGVTHWALLLPLFLAAVAVAAVAGRRLALFAGVWALLSWAALTWIYVASPFEYSEYLDSSADRVVSSLVLGGAALVPLLVAPALYARWDARR